MRGCLLLTSLGAIGLLARALQLWDTNTVQLLMRDVREARFLKFWLYSALLGQLLLYLVVSLVRLDYGGVVVFLGLNCACAILR